jgi:cytosine deaminase
LVAVRLGIGSGRISAIESVPAGPELAAAPLAITPPVDPHVHLDKAFSWSAFPNRAATMAAALAANGREAEQRSADQVLERGEAGLNRAWRYGLRGLRSHVDSAGPAAEVSWQALLELQRRWQGRLELQLVALVPIAYWSTPEGLELARRVAGAGGLLGGVLGPPFSRSTSDSHHLLALLRLAERLGCAVDLHVDEGSAAPGAGVTLLTSLIERQGCGVPVTCSHASSMGLLPLEPRIRLAERMAAVGLQVVALPTTNFWLLGHQDGLTTPERPLAPIRLLQQAGVTVALGGDNVQDPWYPGGDFDPIELLRFSATAAQQAPWRRLGLVPFTSAAARLMGLDWDGVLRLGSPADLVVLGASSWSDLLARPPQRRVLRAGKWLEPPPAEARQPLLAPFAALGGP